MFNTQLQLMPSLIAALLLGAAFAQEPAAPPVDTPAAEDAERTTVEELAKENTETAEAIPEGEIKILQAVVISVKGRAEWRQTDQASWKKAAENDLLMPGAKIRTGSESELGLRVGKNATLLVGSRTRASLPEVIQRGAELKTVLGLQRGRVDFKVDRVGLKNDFKVVTPSLTLAVRGTGGALRYGTLIGTETVAARYNTINSIGLTYFAPLVEELLSGSGKSSDPVRDPVLAAMFDTIWPPSALLYGKDSQVEDDLLVGGGLLRLHEVEPIRLIQYGREGVLETMRELSHRDPGSPGGTQPPPYDPPTTSPPPTSPPPTSPPPTLPTAPR